MNFCMINHKRTASNSKGKFMEVENNTGNALENFQNYLFEKNIIKKMDHNISSDPNANCDILFENNYICPLNESSLTKENIKFNTHSEWQIGRLADCKMNNVLLKKINKKSDKYSKLLKIPKTDANYAAQKIEFNEYVKSVKNDIRIAKRNYYFHVSYTKIISNKPGIQFV